MIHKNAWRVAWASSCDNEVGRTDRIFVLVEIQSFIQHSSFEDGD